MSSMGSSRRNVQLQKEFVSNVSNSEFPGHFPGEDLSWNLETFSKKCHVEIQRLSLRSVEFDVVGVDASVANAIRRVLIAEVPTVAIEQVFVFNNTSVIQDEVLCHRLGLVPLNVDPRQLNDRQSNESDPTDQDTVVFKLQVVCERNMHANKNSTDPDELYINSEVLSSALVWDPKGDQENIFRDPRPAATNPNIVLAKLRPGQEIDLELHAIKGIGSEHAKWSPVATASYRLLPKIVISGPVPSELCEKFASCFSPGVVEVTKNSRTGDSQAKIVNPRNDTVSREVLRHKEFEDLVELSRVRDHFIYQVESEGPYTPEELLHESISVLREKIKKVRDCVANLQHVGGNDDMDQQ